jgi:hypothetical protein
MSEKVHFFQGETALQDFGAPVLRTYSNIPETCSGLGIHVLIEHMGFDSHLSDPVSTRARSECENPARNCMCRSMS